MRQLLDQGLKQIADQGLKIASYAISQPAEVYESDTDYVMFLPTKMVMKGDTATIHSKGFLIASRSKAGGEWVFLDGAGIHDPRALQQIFPGLPAEPTLPPITHELVEN
jgi:hypothetical protein